MDYVWFSLVMLLGQFSPGPDMLLLMKNALSLPLRTAWCTVLGIAVGLMVHTSVALGGLSVLLVRSPVAGRVLGLCGGLYLGWLAWKLLRSAVSVGTTGGIEGRVEVLTPKGAFVQGLVTNLLNPKAVIFLASVLAAMLGPEPSVVRKVGFWLIVVGQALVFWSLFVWLLQRPAVQRAYLGAERVWNGGFGLALGLVAVRALMGALWD